MRISAAALVALLALSGCAGESAGPDEAGTNREVAVVVPADADPAAVALPDGLTSADLPEDREARRDLMMGWWQTSYDDVASGWGSAEFDGTISFTFNMNLADPAEAAGWCPFLDAMTALYYPDGGVGELSLAGWVRNPRGLYEDPGWETVGC